MQRFYYGMVLILVFIGLALQASLLLWIGGLLTLPMLVYSFFHSNRLFQGMGLAFLTSGALLFPYSNVSLQDIPPLFSNNLTLVVFVAIVPLMQAAIETLQYDKQVQTWLFKGATTKGKLHTRALLTTYGFVPFMNLSVLPLLQHTLKESLTTVEKKERDVLISQTTLRGYALALVWMPMEIMVVTAIGLTGESYFSLIPYLLLLSVLMTLVEIGKRSIGQNEGLSIAYHGEGGPSKWSLISAVIIFLVLVLALGEWLELSFILTVVLLIPLFSLGWTSLLGEGRAFLRKGFLSLGKQLQIGIHPFIVLFVSLGWFTGILNQTELLGYVQEPLYQLGEKPVLLLAIIPLSFYLLAMVGIHPIASMVLVHEVIGPILMPTMPIPLTVMYIVSALATFTMSPYGIIVTMTARHTEQNPYRIMIINLPFALLFAAIAISIMLLF
ncbi:hypothetical protein [Shouchella lehensis]|uniref:DUF401 family protein n=1 Tax=Shouchella lehensis TaxID=300825 RepID=A0A4Y7WHU1_9BACI|nr:hypothetical protein [Shouchella lehensis]MBG9782687.1 hypothetical protein [Shouchella lehensis]TES47695.1 hypothetical protein E2L03_11040 [Shouchella lehensis]